MTDKIEEPNELEQLLAEALEAKSDPEPVDLDALGVNLGSTPRPRGRDNVGKAKKGG